MNWAHFAIIDLHAGKPCKINPRGNSMTGLINSGEDVELVPVGDGLIGVGSVVLVRVKGMVYLHLVKATKKQGDSVKYQIGNNKGGINGWVSQDAIYGKAVSVAGRRL